MEHLDEFTAAYIEVLLWASTDDEDQPLDKTKTSSDISPEMMEQIRTDCREFQDQCWDWIRDDLSRAGHDFFLTRTESGSGFWDGDWPEHGDVLTDVCHDFGNVEPYVGDDGLIYQFPHLKQKLPH